MHRGEYRWWAWEKSRPVHAVQQLVHTKLLLTAAHCGLWSLRMARQSVCTICSHVLVQPVACLPLRRLHDPSSMQTVAVRVHDGTFTCPVRASYSRLPDTLFGPSGLESRVQ